MVARYHAAMTLSARQPMAVTEFTPSAPALTAFLKGVERRADGTGQPAVAVTKTWRDERSRRPSGLPDSRRGMADGGLADPLLGVACRHPRLARAWSGATLVGRLLEAQRRRWPPKTASPCCCVSWSALDETVAAEALGVDEAALSPGLGPRLPARCRRPPDAHAWRALAEAAQRASCASWRRIEWHAWPSFASWPSAPPTSVTAAPASSARNSGQVRRAPVLARSTGCRAGCPAGADVPLVYLARLPGHAASRHLAFAARSGKPVRPRRRVARDRRCPGRGGRTPRRRSGGPGTGSRHRSHRRGDVGRPGAATGAASRLLRLVRRWRSDTAGRIDAPQPTAPDLAAAGLETATDDE